MALTNDFLTLWELGHRLAGEHPYRWRIVRVSPAVRDNFRLLLNEILSAHLESTLIMKKWHPGADTSEDMHIRYYLDDINQCIQHGLFQASFLKSVAVERWEFKHWCQQSGYPPPEFWFGLDYQYPADEDDETPDEISNGQVESATADEAESPDKLRPSTRTRIACQEIAKALWSEAPETTISAMTQHESIQKLGGGAVYDDKTLHKWLSQVAPPGIRGKPGRPKK